MTEVEFIKTTDDLICPHCGQKLEAVLAKPVMTKAFLIKGPATWLFACSKCKKILSCGGTFG